MALIKPTTKQRAAFGDRISELTTVFTPPCQVTWLLTTTKVPSQFPPFPTTGPSSCDPPSWADNISQKGFAYYSPAICPLGFSVGCTASDRRSDDGFPAITAGETAMYCVPSGFTCTSDTTDFRGGIWGYMRTASANGASVTVGPAIQIRWREEDLSSLQTDPLNPAVPVIGVSRAASSTSLPGVTSSTTGLVQITATNSASSTTTIGVEIEQSPNDSTIISTETGMPASTSLLLQTRPNGSASTSNQPVGTPTAAGGSSQSSGGVGDNASSTASSTNTAAMALSGILIVILFVFLAATTFRRYHRYRTGKIDSFLPPCIGLRARDLLGKRGSGLPSHQNPANTSAKDLEAELGTDGPVPELGPGNPLGTKENPAELPGSSERYSWMSQVSRIFNTKLRKEALSV
ncbi:hypothetical protein F5Y05DRAFT_414237 [Hypoxylon sp. FL0543]|nr:hypothetical protein F5Y05DRAFT_414237 [Hypoxylon sp. FL0543]